MAKVVPIGLKTRMDDRMRAALGAMPVAVAWHRIDDGIVEFMNQRFTELFGYNLAEAGTVAELIAKTFVDRQQAEAAIAALARLQAEVVLEPIHFPEQDVMIVSKAGAHIPTRFSGVMVPEANMSLAIFVDISEQKEREARLSAIAAQDPLTGLHNRRAFDAAFAEALNMSQSGQSAGLIVMDLDGLKAVNDGLGHAAGDSVLRHFSTLLKSTFRRSDVVSRWGGDEFAVLIRHPCCRADILAALSRLEKALEQPIEVEGRIVQVGVSSGIAIYPEDAENLSDLYRIADQAMYQTKRARHVPSR